MDSGLLVEKQIYMMGGGGILPHPLHLDRKSASCFFMPNQAIHGTAFEDDPETENDVNGDSPFAFWG